MNIIGFLGFWLKTISYGDIPIVVVICELYDNGNNFTFVDHSVYRVSFPFTIHLRYSCNERSYLRLIRLSEVHEMYVVYVSYCIGDIM